MRILFSEVAVQLLRVLISIFIFSAFDAFSTAIAYTSTDSSSIALKLEPGFQQLGSLTPRSDTVTKIYVRKAENGKAEKIRLDIFKKPSNISVENILNNIYQEFSNEFVAEATVGTKHEITPLIPLPQKNAPFNAWLFKASLKKSQVVVDTFLIMIDADQSTLYIITYLPPIGERNDAALAKLKSMIQLCYQSGACNSVQ